MWWSRERASSRGPYANKVGRTPAQARKTRALRTEGKVCSTACGWGGACGCVGGAGAGSGASGGGCVGGERGGGRVRRHRCCHRAGSERRGKLGEVQGVVPGGGGGQVPIGLQGGDELAGKDKS